MMECVLCVFKTHFLTHTQGCVFYNWVQIKFWTKKPWVLQPINKIVGYSKQSKKYPTHTLGYSTPITQQVSSCEDMCECIWADDLNGSEMFSKLLNELAVLGTSAWTIYLPCLIMHLPDMSTWKNCKFYVYNMSWNVISVYIMHTEYLAFSEE